MTKKAPFFSHDMNARHDPKVSAMRCVYGTEGYGWFWMLVEMMAESDGYQLDYASKYTTTAYAMQLQCKPDIMHKFIHDCITEFELFEADDMYFWSNSLRNRLHYRDAVSEKRTKAARKRWEKSDDDANAMQMHSKCNANAMQNDANETKQNETKQNETKQDIADKPPPVKRFTPPSLEEVQAYCSERKNNVDAEKWLDYYTSNGWKVGKVKMSDWKAAVRTWEKNAKGGGKSEVNRGRTENLNAGIDFGF
jgi:hypothetical protein